MATRVPPSGVTGTTTTTTSTTSTGPRGSTIKRALVAIGIFLAVFIGALLFRAIVGSIVFWPHLHLFGIQITVGDVLAHDAYDIVVWIAGAAAVMYYWTTLGGKWRSAIKNWLILIGVIAALVMYSPASLGGVPGSELGRTIHNQVTIEQLSPAQTGRTDSVVAQQNNENQALIADLHAFCVAYPAYSKCAVWFQPGPGGKWSLSIAGDSPIAKNLIASYCATLKQAQAIWPDVHESPIGMCTP